MTDSTYLDACKSYIIAQILRAKEEKEKEKALEVHSFVTISREAGAGGTSIAQMLVRFLNENDMTTGCPWTLFDKNLIHTVIEEHNLPSDFVMFMPENKVSEIQSIFEQLFGLHPPHSKLLDKVSHTILHLAQMGNVVIVGRGANIIARKLPGGFHVRLIAPPESRIKHLQQYYQFDRKKALEYMKLEDHARRSYVRKNFSKDINDKLLYDLIINTGTVSYDTAVRIIGERVLEKKRQVLYV